MSVPDPSSGGLTEAEREALRDLLTKITPGRWKLWGMTVVADQDGTSNAETAVVVAQTYFQDEHGKPRTWDATFICQVQQALPRLLDALDESERILADRLAAVRRDALPETEGMQRRLHGVERAAGWGETSFGEEIAHLHEEVSEAFRAWRHYGDADVTWDTDDKPQGVPMELADVVIGCFYIAEEYGFDLMAAVEQKSAYNAGRNYQAEGRQLRAALDPATRDQPVRGATP